MPRYDGTGPKGRGPLTGQGRGFCILKVLDAADEPISGFAGRSGYPVRIEAAGAIPAGGSLSARMRKAGSDIRQLRRRLEDLEAKAFLPNDRRRRRPIV